MITQLLGLRSPCSIQIGRKVTSGLTQIDLDQQRLVRQPKLEGSKENLRV